MKALIVYARLYGDCLAKTFRGLRKNLWTALLPIGLVVGEGIIGALLRPLGMVGGFIMTLVGAAVASCYLYFVGEIVGNARVTVAEFRVSIGRYFWSVINLGFVLWIVSLLLGMVTRGNRNGGLLQLMVLLAELILLNPAPETIYQRGTYGGLETIQRCVDFLQANWIEWFIPNLLIGLPLALALIAGIVLFGPLGVLIGVLAHLVMIFRGHLFQALDGTSHRQRMYRYRTGA